MFFSIPIKENKSIPHIVIDRIHRCGMDLQMRTVKRFLHKKY